MSIHKSLLILVLAIATAAPAYSAVYVDVNLGAPPEPRYEVVPETRPGYYWSPGYWEWDGYNRVWMEGYWVREKPGYVWVPDRWRHYDRGWRLERGHYYVQKHDNGKHKGWYKNDRGRHDHGGRGRDH